MPWTSEQKQRMKALRAAQDAVIPIAAGKPAIINECMAIIREWQPGTRDNPIQYVADQDVRMYNGNPYMCKQSHTHSGEVNWNPKHYAAGWIEYHGTSVETARLYIQPLGAHDAYQTGEYAIEGGKVYRCKKDATVYPPSTLPASWELVTAAAPEGSTPEPEQPAAPEPEPVDEWPEFVQPTGAHNAYALGAKITYKGKHYKSKIAANTYSPDAYPAGWELVV